MIRNAAVVALAVILTAPTMASAQGGPGFLFKRPVLSIGVRAGYAVPRAGGELLAFTRDEFIQTGADTLSSLGFDSPYLGGEIAIHPWERWDIAVAFGWARSRSISEYRRWVDAAGDPIEQETTFQVVTGTVGAKYYLQDRGRSVGTLAWVPSRLTPYVGAGVGVSSYEFSQVGDFVDTSTLEVSSDYLKSTGEGLLGYGAVGVDLTLGRHAVLTGEARYAVASAAVDGQYDGFDNVDLAGLQLVVGMGFQF